MASFTLLKSFAREAVQAALVSAGASVMVIDPSLLPSLAVVADMPFLTSLGIKQVFNVADVVESDSPALVYLMGNAPSNTESMIRQYQRDQVKGLHRPFSCLCVPRVDSLQVKLLEQAGLFDIIRLKALPLELVPLDCDLASMNINTEEFLVHQDPSCLYDVASTLATFVRLGGFQLGRVSSFGPLVAPACHYLNALTAEYQPQEGSQLLHVVMFDRRMDLVTPLLTQLTYAGILDEICNLKAGVVCVSHEEPNDRDLASPRTALTTAATPKATSTPTSTTTSTPTPPSKHHRLSVEGDPIFAKLSDLSFVKVLSQMKVQVKNLQEQMKKGDDLSISELRAFVGQLSATMQEKRFVELHVKLARLVARITEEDLDFSLILGLENDIVEQGKNTALRDILQGLIIQHRPLAKVLRLLCLYSVVNNGIKREHLEPVTKDLLHSYGYDKLEYVVRLEQMGLLLAREDCSGKPPWSGLVQAFGLLKANKIDSARPKQEEKKNDKPRREGEDEIYSYSNYFPLSAKLLHRSLFRPVGLEKYLEAFSLCNAPLRRSSNQFQIPEPSSVCLIFFVGGLCYSELAALRTLWTADRGQGLSRPALLVATTNMLTGQRLVVPS